MRIHHLNCISTCPVGGRLMDGRSASLVRRGELACHCLLVETGPSLVLVDTGLGLRDVADPQGRLSAFFLALLSPAFREEMTAVRQVQRLGYDPRDVRHVILTHLDFDHAGGLDDFPGAAVHLLASERDDAFAQRSWLDRQRYRPRQWGTRGQWLVYEPDGGEAWYGFERVRALQGIPPEIVMIPLLGHTHGHAGVAVDRGDRWLLLAADAYFFHAEMDPVRPRCTPGLRFYQWMMQKDGAARRANQRRLRALGRAHAHEITIFCGHDVSEFERLSGHSARVPADRMAGATAAAPRAPRPAWGRLEAAARVRDAARAADAADGRGTAPVVAVGGRDPAASLGVRGRDRTGGRSPARWAPTLGRARGVEVRGPPSRLAPRARITAPVDAGDPASCRRALASR